MKKIIILMNVFMGLGMSLILSFVGTLMSKRFSITSWLFSFGISFVISLIIGFLVPIKILGDKACNKLKVPAQSFKGTLVSAAISDLIYTPIITTVMVVLSLTNAAKHDTTGNVPPIPVVLVPSLIISLIVGYIVIMILQPMLIRWLTKDLPKDMPQKGE